MIAKRSGTRKRHEDILATMKAPLALSLRPLGQAAKTAPSHGAIVGSIPAGVTKRKGHPQCGCLCIPGLVRIAACPLPLRRPRSFHAPLAQLVEQLTLNQRAQGSSPWRCTRRTPAGRQFLYSSLAQSVEHAAVNRRVVGSSPTGGARNKPHQTAVFRLFGAVFLLQITHFLFYFFALFFFETKVQERYLRAAVPAFSSLISWPQAPHLPRGQLAEKREKRGGLYNFPLGAIPLASR